MKDVCFLFGARAEADYKLPLGEQFTTETILKKRTKMYNELDQFYSKRMVNGYIESYKHEYLFTKNSNAFFEIIYRALKQCYEESKYEDIDEDTKSLFQYLYSSDNPHATTKEAFKKNVVNKLYQYIISDIDAQNGRNHYKYKSLLNRMTFYGSVEKDFSSIIDPKGAGLKQFWRFVNYLWSAFFSIVLPLLDNSESFIDKTYYAQYQKNKYRAVLDNLQDVVAFLYSNEYLSEVQSNGYYEKISSKFSGRIYNVITTNYTPFVKNIFNNAAYVAGELSSFEYPHHLEVKNIIQSGLKTKAFVFPFLLTQAPVKPIIEPKQISQYSNMHTTLKNSKYLIILGYNINSNDNHINSYIRQFVMRNKTHLIFCKYSPETLSDSEIDQECKNITRKLYITTDRKNIHVLQFNGNAGSLCDSLNDFLCIL